MNNALLAKLTKDQTIQDLRQALEGATIAGSAISVSLDHRALPYQNHVVVGWVDGPAPSNVMAVISAAAPDGAHWRRFTLTRVGSGKYEIDAFPTPFPNADAPLSPGIPPAGRTAR